MTFLQPALPNDLDIYSWPLSYITYSVHSTDGGSTRSNSTTAPARNWPSTPRASTSSGRGKLPAT